MTDVNFADAVAESSGRPADEVTRLLAEAGISTVDRPSTPARLRLTRLMFSGTKVDVPDAGAFVFDQELTGGLWAFCSEKNDAGKTSVLEIAMWALRGERRSQFQPDVLGWLSRVELTGTVDESEFVVAFDVRGGKPSGALTSGGESHTFDSDAAFKAVMSGFMMDRLRLATFTTWNKGNQAPAFHAWSAYATGLYLPREGLSAVIGDTTEGGMPTRLLLMFIGVRWGSTLVACQAAVNDLEAQLARITKASDHVRSATQDALAAREAELALARSALDALPPATVSFDDIAAAQEVWEDRVSDYSAAYQRMLDTKAAAAAGKKSAADARKRLQDRKEAAHARRFLHGLSPTTCPRCTTPIGAERNENEKLHDRCAVCDRDVDLPAETDDDDATSSVESLSEEVDAVVQDAFAAQESADDAERAEREAARHLDSAKQRYQQLRGHLAEEAARQEASQTVTRLEAVISQLRDLAEAPAPAPGHGDRDEVEARLSLLRAAEKEATARVKTGYDEIITSVNEAILDLGQRFGFDSLQRADLKRNATLPLKKGGKDTSFGRCTPGERLRLRIAVVIALLRVAAEQGVGRHPGLLLIDSIGAEETQHGDLAEFMRELRAVTDDLDIQTIVASARPEILEHVDPNQQVAVTGDAYLW